MVYSTETNTVMPISYKTTKVKSIVRISSYRYDMHISFSKESVADVFSK